MTRQLGIDQMQGRVELLERSERKKGGKLHPFSVGGHPGVAHQILEHLDDGARCVMQAKQIIHADPHVSELWLIVPLLDADRAFS